MLCSQLMQLSLTRSHAGGGYVCAIAPSLFEQAHSDALPGSLSGADFLAMQGRHLDTATTLQPDTRCRRDAGLDVGTTTCLAAHGSQGRRATDRVEGNRLNSWPRHYLQAYT